MRHFLDRGTSLPVLSLSCCMNPASGKACLILPTGTPETRPPLGPSALLRTVNIAAVTRPAEYYLLVAKLTVEDSITIFQSGQRLASTSCL
jgi:hypothetical protein